MTKNLFRTLVLGAFLLFWTTLLLAEEHTAERTLVHRLFSDYLVVQRNCSVRFAWDSNMDCNRFDGEGLPAVPFHRRIAWNY